MSRFRPSSLRAFWSRCFMLLWLTFAWVVLWGTWELGTILAGLLVGLFIMLVLPIPRVPVEGLLRPISTIWLVMVVAFFLVRSSATVAWLAVRPSAPPPSAVLRAPMRVKSDFTLAMAVNTLNLLPGGIVVRVDPLRRDVYIHVLDVGSEKSVKSFYDQVAAVEKIYLRAFERPEDWRPSATPYSAPTEEAPR